MKELTTELKEEFESIVGGRGFNNHNKHMKKMALNCMEITYQMGVDAENERLSYIILNLREELFRCHNNTP